MKPGATIKITQLGIGQNIPTRPQVLIENTMEVTPRMLAQMQELFKDAYPNIPYSDANLVKMTHYLLHECNNHGEESIVTVNPEHHRLVRAILAIYAHQFQESPEPEVTEIVDAAGRKNVRIKGAYKPSGTYEFMHALGEALDMDETQVDVLLNRHDDQGRVMIRPSLDFQLSTHIYTTDAMVARNMQADGSASIPCDAFDRYGPKGLEDFTREWAPQLGSKVPVIRDNKLYIKPDAVRAIRSYAAQLQKAMPQLKSPALVYPFTMCHDAEKLAAQPELQQYVQAIDGIVIQKLDDRQVIYCDGRDAHQVMEGLKMIVPAIGTLGNVEGDTVTFPSGLEDGFIKRLKEVAKAITTADNNKETYHEAAKLLAGYSSKKTKPDTRVSNVERAAPAKTQPAAKAAAKEVPVDPFEEFRAPLAGLDSTFKVVDRLGAKANGEDIIFKSSTGERRIKFDNDTAARLAEVQLLRLVRNPDSKDIRVEQDPKHKRDHWLVVNASAYDTLTQEGTFLKEMLGDLEAEFRTDASAAEKSRAELVAHVDDLGLTARHTEALKAEIKGVRAVA